MKTNIIKAVITGLVTLALITCGFTTAEEVNAIEYVKGLPSYPNSSAPSFEDASGVEADLITVRNRTATYRYNRKHAEAMSGKNVIDYYETMLIMAGFTQKRNHTFIKKSELIIISQTDELIIIRIRI